jgi:NTP pyrophosphatase (non-canonical NTP hydrolase)
MKLENEFQPIREWAAEKGILAQSTIKKQFEKLMEEVEETRTAIKNENLEELKDGIGDCVVVLTNMAALAGMTIEDCINSAYEVISKRKGKMINGKFVKEN